jgi:hypothetical protein
MATLTETGVFLRVTLTRNARGDGADVVAATVDANGTVIRKIRMSEKAFSATALANILDAVETKAKTYFDIA